MLSMVSHAANEKRESIPSLEYLFTGARLPQAIGEPANLG